ncbi:MAG: response regulator [Elusimicrobiota bacterium]
MKRILVADDDPECRSLLRDFLQERGYEVLLANDGAELYRMVPEVMPDLIVSDLDMPGLSGGTAQALLRISDKTKNIPILFVTGQSKDRQEHLVEFRPDTRILYKPLDLRELGFAVEEALGLA